MSNFNIVTTEELRGMKGSEGLILQGCGGDLNEWIDGINEMLTDEGILLEGTKFSNISAFKNDGLTSLLFHFTDDVKINMGKLAMWRLGTHDTFSGKWLTDYVNNRLGGFEMSDFEKQIRRLNSFEDTESSFDFQCDISDGYPVSLMWNWKEGKAWLAPNETLDGEPGKLEEAMRLCEKYGIKDCSSVKEFNDILASLGEDASNCKIHDESEDIDLY